MAHAFVEGSTLKPLPIQGFKAVSASMGSLGKSEIVLIDELMRLAFWDAYSVDYTGMLTL